MHGTETRMCKVGGHRYVQGERFRVLYVVV